MSIHSYLIAIISYYLLPEVFLDYDSDFEQKCKASEDYSAFVPCVNISNELGDLFTEYDKAKIPEDVHQNMTEMCETVITCFNASECQTSQDYKRYYKAKCQNLEFLKIDLHECISKVYNTMYDGSYNCIEMYNFLQQDLTQKKESFDSGKFCFLQIVGKMCSTEANEYITSNYEKVVDLLTVKPEGDSCAEPFHEFHSQQCLAVMNNAKAKITEIFGKDFPTIFDQRWSSVCNICQKAQECAHNCCQFDNHDRKTVDSLCSTFKVSGYEDCSAKLHGDNSDSAKYPCLMKIQSANQTIWQESCTLYEALKNCTRSELKQELKEYCGISVIQDDEEQIAVVDLLNSNNCTSDNEC